MQKILIFIVLLLFMCGCIKPRSIEYTLSLPDFIDPYDGGSPGFIKEATIKVSSASKVTISNKKEIALSGAYQVFVSLNKIHTLFLLDKKNKDIWEIHDKHINIWEIVKIEISPHNLYWAQSSPQVVTGFNVNLVKQCFVYIRPRLTGKYGPPPLRQNIRKDIDKIWKAKPILSRRD